jgi:hypothetical protein
MWEGVVMTRLHRGLGLQSYQILRHKKGNSFPTIGSNMEKRKQELRCIFENESNV